MGTSYSYMYGQDQPYELNESYNIWDVPDLKEELCIKYIKYSGSRTVRINARIKKPNIEDETKYVYSDHYVDIDCVDAKMDYEEFYQNIYSNPVAWFRRFCVYQVQYVKSVDKLLKTTQGQLTLKLADYHDDVLEEFKCDDMKVLRKYGEFDKDDDLVIEQIVGE